MDNLQDFIGFIEHLKSLNKTQIEIDSVLRNLIKIQEKQLSICGVMPTLFYVLNEKNNGLTALSKYTLINEDSGGYLLKDDNDKERWFKKEWFRITPLK